MLESSQTIRSCCGFVETDLQGFSHHECWMDGSHGGSCDTSHKFWTRHCQSTSISFTLFYGKWRWSELKSAFANLKSLHMLRLLKCNLESWQEISSMEPWMCRWLVKTAKPALSASWPLLPKVIYNFYWLYFNTSVYKWRALFQSTVHPLWQMFKCVLLNILRMKC